MAFLGIDAGASSTKWVVSDGRTISVRGSSEPMDGHIYREESAERMDRVLKEIGQKARGITAVYLGITGLSNPTQEQITKKLNERFVGAKVLVIPDIELAYRAHFEPGEGIFLYAGTGSVAIHITEKNEVIQTGGWGYMLGDEGGGFWIGRESIRRILTKWDSGLELSPFDKAMLAEMDCSSWDEIKGFVYGQNRSAVAALTKKVFELSETGDTEAQAVLRSAGQQLAILVKEMNMRIISSNISVVFSGGVSRENSYLWKTLERELHHPLKASQIDIAERAAQLAGSL